MSNLKSCPWCDCADSLVTLEQGDVADWARWAVWCQNCAVTGPCRETEQGAIESWNNREGQSIDGWVVLKPEAYKRDKEREYQRGYSQALADMHERERE